MKILALALAVPLIACCDPPPIQPDSSLKREKALPKVSLRGYGTVSGHLFTSPGGGSILEIACEGESQAQLTLAKYLSDLQILPGVKATEGRLGGTAVTLHEVRAQGCIAAVRSGATVFVLAAADKGALEKLSGSLKGRWSGVVSSPEVPVPMWLDRWDRHGFRFYYAPFERPRPEGSAAGKPAEAYDFTREFEFARDHQAGLVMWSVLSKEASAEGVTNESWWAWGQRWARAWNIPLGVNLSAYNYSLPNWVANRYREQLAQPMPCFLGDSMSIANGRGTEGKAGELAWGATEARDAMFGALQQTVRRLAKDPNIVTWLEPHGEFYQGGDAFMGYGPAVDATFREFLKGRYGKPEALAAAWGVPVPSWESVRAPELAEFAGWGPRAVDLAGTWRVGYPQPKQEDLEKWFGEGFDDAAWETVTAPGDDHAFFLPKKFAIYRRTFDLPPGRFGKGERVWLTLWDLNVSWGKPVSVWLNGKKIGESPCAHPHPHWMSCEATEALRPSGNRLALGLPNGTIGYRVYLTTVEPRQYPAFEPSLNTKWADYVDWRESVRMDSARRGLEMIREVDPDRQIDLMAPHQSAEGLKNLAEKYGGNFKDTGFMSGLWADLLPSMMRGSGLPFSLEPGGPADNPTTFRRFLGLWSTEALQGVDYFSHIGCVAWNPGILKVYEETLPLFRLIGKYHGPPADVATLWAMRIDALTGFPWGSDLNTNNPGGWNARGLPESLLPYCPRDAITEGDFARGNAARYKVVIDTNTSILDDDLLAQIERYVRDGGVFVTLGHTGRHTSRQANAWPIEKLTGFKTLTVEKFSKEGHSIGKFAPDDPDPGSPGQPLAGPARNGQTVYPRLEEWMKSPYFNGLRLKKMTEDAQELILWKDGTTAVGMRRLGKGCIIEFGLKYGGRGLGVPTEAFFPIFDMAGVRKNAGRLEAASRPDAKPYRDYILREYVSNNGLYDVWVLWNPKGNQDLQASIVLEGKKPAFALDVLTGAEAPVKDGRLEGLSLKPLETRAYLTPRGEIARAPLEWFELQRSWWRGTEPVKKGFPQPSTRYTRVLNEDWAWRAVAPGEASDPWADPSFDDKSWERLPLGLWSSPERKDIRQAMFRKTFTVPPEWDNGVTRLWIRGSGYPDFAREGRVFLDGKMIMNWGGEGPPAFGENVLKAGSRHTLAIEARSPGVINGLAGDCWLSHVPEPARKIDLAGEWAAAPDHFHPKDKVTLPGGYAAKTLRRQVTVPRDCEGRTLVVVIRSERMFGLYVNGTYIPFNGGPNKGGNEINITPFVRFGDKNDIELVSWYDKGNISYLSLHVYEKGAHFP